MVTPNHTSKKPKENKEKLEINGFNGGYYVGPPQDSVRVS
jgi:hypothetical protein